MLKSISSRNAADGALWQEPRTSRNPPEGEAAATTSLNPRRFAGLFGNVHPKLASKVAPQVLTAALLLGLGASLAASAPLQGSERGLQPHNGVPLSTPQNQATDSESQDLIRCRPKPWSGAGPMKNDADFDWAQRFIQTNHGVGQLVPVDDFDSTKTPAIMIGGIHPSHHFTKAASSLLAMPTAGEMDSGKQVFNFVYDRDKPLEDISRELATAISDLHAQYYSGNTKLDIVTHSMGGLIAWAALNTLNAPDASRPNDVDDYRRRGGFSSVRLRSYDAPAAGLASDWITSAAKLALPFAHLIAPSWVDYGVGSAASLVANGPFMRSLFNEPLPGVSFENHGSAKASKFRGLPWYLAEIVQRKWDGLLDPFTERGDEELRALSLYLLKGVEPPEPHLKNLANMLRVDDRFAQLLTRLQTLNAADGETDDPQALRQAYLETMPPLAKGHADLPEDLRGIADLVAVEAPRKSINGCSAEEVARQTRTERLERHVAQLAAQPRNPGSDGLRSAIDYVRNTLDDLPGISAFEDVFSAEIFASHVDAEPGMNGGLGSTFTNHDVLLPNLRQPKKTDDPRRQRHASWYSNVVGILPGKGQHQNEAVVIMAHVDSHKTTPGADDNASGLAAMLEAARDLASTDHNRTIVFCATNLEEHGAHGAKRFLKMMDEHGYDVGGIVNLEMLGYRDTKPGSQEVPTDLLPHVQKAVNAAGAPNTTSDAGDPSAGDLTALVGLVADGAPAGDFVALIANTPSAELAAKFMEGAADNTKILPLVVPGVGLDAPDVVRSDHASAWEQDIPAIMLTDTANFRNPCYHRACDTPDTLDYEFLEQNARAVALGVKGLAGTPVAPVEIPELAHGGHGV